MATASRSGAHPSWIHGSGHLETQSRHVEGFSTVSLEAVGDVHIRQTGTESLTITADDNVLPLLTSTVEDGTLSLSVEHGVSFQDRPPIRWEVTVKEMSGIELSGSGTLSASEIDSPELRVDLTGSGTLTIEGVVGSQTVALSGSGGYQAPDLHSKRAMVTISGAADATVAATDTLDVTISGVGKVRYVGHPQIRQSISGVGRVTPR